MALPIVLPFPGVFIIFTRIWEGYVCNFFMDVGLEFFGLLGGAKKSTIKKQNKSQGNKLGAQKHNPCLTGKSTEKHQKTVHSVYFVIGTCHLFDWIFKTM